MSFKLSRLSFASLCLSSLCLLSSCSFRAAEIRDVVIRGKADISSVPLDSGTVVRLDGAWHFWGGELLDAAEVRDRLSSGESSYQAVPGKWSELGLFDDASRLVTSGTLALELTLPPGRSAWALRLQDGESACEISVDDDTPVSVGRVSPLASDEIPLKGVEIAPFTAPRDGKVLVVMRVSNHALPMTGTWVPPYVGTLRAINNKRLFSSVTTSLITGAILFMGLYHFALYLLRRKDRAVLLFAVICILMAARNLMMGERLLAVVFSHSLAGWRLACVVEHLSVHMCVALFFLFFREIFPSEVPIPAVRASIAVCLLWAGIRIFLPSFYAERFLPYFEYFVVIAGLYIVYANVRALLHRREGALVIAVGIVILFLTALNDVLLSNRIIQSAYLTSYGMFAFTFSQSFFLSRRFANLFTTVERYLHDLQTLNRSLERFIPREMLEFLGKRSVVDIELGDYIEQRMSVFFLDIRNFTELSELMSPAENFRFINRFLEQFGPVVRAHGGFIDKYLGDGFMALFPGDPDNAVAAAIDMQGRLAEFNRLHAPGSATDIRFGVGIHTGDLMLGTIGENLRMDTSVISDTVNTASRLESLNKTLGTSILISQQTRDSLRYVDQYLMTKHSGEKVKGKKEPLRAWSVEGRREESEPEFLPAI